MTRTNEVPYLIIFEGQDRTGKDTMIEYLKRDLGKDVFVYRQMTCQEAGVDYRNKEQFEAYLEKAFKKTYEDIRKIHEKFPDRLIVTSRLWISDDVYSKMFNRRHIVSSTYKDLFLTDFDGNVVNIVFLWNSWYDFIKRMDDIKDEYSRNEYSAVEFLRVKELFLKYAERNAAKVINVKAETTPDQQYAEVCKILSSLF